MGTLQVVSKPSFNIERLMGAPSIHGKKTDGWFSLHSSHTGFFLVFFLHAANWRGGLRTRSLCACSPYGFVVCVHVFLCPGMRIRLSLLFWDCVMFLSLHCEMGLLFFPWCVIVVVFPRLFVCCGCKYLLGCCWVVLAMLWPRTTLNHFAWPELRSPLLGCHPVFFCFLTKLWIVHFVVCRPWLVFRLYWSGYEGLVFLKNLVCLKTTQTELEGCLSSPQPLNSTGREVRA